MRLTPNDIRKFRRTIRNHYRARGRDLPWRRTKNSYRIVVSEVMLQQTQVARVLQYYPKFLKQFPDFQTLAAAPLSKILTAWQGLGYNRRAIFLKKIAQRAQDEHHGALPSDPEVLAAFPGIGKNTAGAIAAFAFNRPALFMETNVRRAFIHFFFPRRRKIGDKEILSLVKKTLDRRNPREWYYALMDYGAYLGGAEKENPNRRSAHYIRQSRFEGSDRQIRAAIIRVMLKEKCLTIAEISRSMAQPRKRIKKIAASLECHGFIKKTKSHFSILS